MLIMGENTKTISYKKPFNEGQNKTRKEIIKVNGYYGLRPTREAQKLTIKAQKQVIMHLRTWNSH